MGNHFRPWWITLSRAKTPRPGMELMSRTRTYVTHKGYTTAGATGAITASVSAVDNVGQHVLLKKAP